MEAALLLLVAAVPDCRYAPEPLAETATTTGNVWLPAHDLFRPILADPKERRFAAGIHRAFFLDSADPAVEPRENIIMGAVSLGAGFGLWGYRTGGCDGVQVNAEGAVFSQFDMSSHSQGLINTDFVVGVSTALRWRELSGRVRFYHQSSHLGDEFLLENPTFVRRDFGYETLELLASWTRSFFRLYLGGGVIVHASGIDLDPLILQGGGELRYEIEAGELLLALVFGADIQSFQERRFGVTGSVQTGAELSRHGRHRIRILLAYLGGFIPFGQFTTDERMHSIGGLVSFEL